MPQPTPLLAALALLASLAVAAPAVAQDGERFARKLTLAPGLVVVVTEGDFEARSTGSYAVRAYHDPAATPENETTFYAAGALRPRDGTVRSIAALPLAGHARPLLMVVVQSAGSGGYLSADAFAVEPRAVRLRASVSGLPPGEDPATALRRKLAAGR